MPTETGKQLELLVKNLKLDDQNPRLPKHLRGKAEEEIIKFMLLEAATLELMQAIGENGYFPGEQLLVVKAEGNDYRVVEGNRRLTALKLLKNPELASVQQSKVQKVYEEAEFKGDEIGKIPCLQFDDEKVIHRYLGYRHITGVQQWNLRQRAEYLESLLNELFIDEDFEDACRELAKMIGSRRDYVKRVLVGQRIYTTIKENDFFGVKNLDESSFYFNYIADSMNRSNIVDFLNVDLDSNSPTRHLDIKNLELWTKWFFEKFGENRTRVRGTSNDLKMLNAILGNDNARRAFLADSFSLKDAYELTSDFGVLFVTSIKSSISDLELAKSLTHKLDEFYLELDDDLRQCIKIAREIKKIKDELVTDEFGDDEL